MSKLSVFVSSTCYDLKALREHLRESIKELGHEAILSDHDGFPVSPDRDAVSNCKKVIEQHADILVLIVGGRYGYIERVAGLSVTNLEYIEAKKKGIDCLVFVDSAVWNLIGIYAKNPTADFSPTVDNPKIFEFIDSIKKENRWIFRFDKTADIITVLTNQLSVRFKDLLIQAREGRITIPAGFGSEGREVIDILFMKPKFWECKLTAALLKDRMAIIKERFKDLERGLVVQRTRRLRARESMQHVRTLIDDQLRFTALFSKIVNEEILASWGASGVAGDPAVIKKVCDKLHGLGMNLYDWELDLRFIIPDEAVIPVFESMQGWTAGMVEQLMEIARKMEELVKAIDAGERNFDLQFKVEGTGKEDEFSQLMDRIARDPDYAERCQNGQ